MAKRKWAVVEFYQAWDKAPGMTWGEIAKFKANGDAFHYAQDLANRTADHGNEVRFRDTLGHRYNVRSVVIAPATEAS